MSILPAIASIAKRRRAARSSVAEPLRVYTLLASQADTARIIVWQTEAPHHIPSLRWRPRGSSMWAEAEATSTLYPYTGAGFGRPERMVHHVALQGEPRGEYEVQFVRGGDVHRFRLLPDSLSGDEVHLAMSGDVWHWSEVAEMTRLIASHDVDALVIGGDWAYADGLQSRFGRWESMWGFMLPHLHDSEGRMIPIVPVIGNHEVIGGYFGAAPHDAAYYYATFPWPGSNKAYGVIDIGNHSSIFVLDSEHTAPRITGDDDQTLWLASEIASRSSRAHLIPTMHIQAHQGAPTHIGGLSARMRAYWSPVLESGGVRVAFQHHGHFYMRSHPMIGTTIDPAGIVWCGDGCYGMVDSRDGYDHEPEPPYYAAETYANTTPHRARHFYLLTLRDTEREVRSIGADGVQFNSFTQPV